MMDRNSRPPRYDSLTITFHWVLAAVILAEVPFGLLAAHLPASGDRQAALLRIHVPLGILILVLTISRAVWRYIRPRPPALSGQPRWQIGVARVTHIFLYVVPVITAVSGLAVLAVSGAAPMLFSPPPGALPNFWHFPPMTVHAFGAFALVGLICIHVTAAIYHQFIRRDWLLARMGIGPASEIPQ